MSEQRAADFERAIGSRWLGWAGALIVVAGIGLFVKYAYDQGWLRVPPAWRCIAGAGFGFLLLAVGEVLRRKVGALAAAGVLAAGIGSVYSSALAAHELYHLVPPSVALALLGATSLLGVSVAIKSGLVSVGALSLLGGYLAPILVTGERFSPVVLPSYLLILLATGVRLAGSRGGKFGWLRFLTWWGTIIHGAAWTATTGLTTPGSAIPFLSIAWVLVHIELAWSSARGLTPLHDDSTEEGRHRRNDFGADWRQWRPMLSSFGITGWATGLAILLARHSTPDLDWLAPAVAAGVSGVASAWVFLCGRRRGLTTDSKHLTVCLAMQSGGLLLLAIGMALTGWVMAIGWLMLGLASGAAATILRSRPLLVYAMVALIVGVGRLLVYDWAFSGMNTGGSEMVSLRFTTWTGMMFVAASSWGVVGALVRFRMGLELRQLSGVCFGMAMMLAAIAFIHPDAAAGAMAAVMLLMGVVCSGLGRSPGMSLFTTIGTAMLIAGTALSFGTRWWLPGPGTWHAIEGLPLRARALSAVLAAAALISAGAVMRRARGLDEARALLGIAGTIMLFAALWTVNSAAAPLCWAWLWLSIIVAGTGAMAGAPRFVGTALGGLAAASVCLAFAYVERWSGHGAMPLLHPGLWAGLVIAAAIPLCSRWLGRSLDDEASKALNVIAGATAFALFLGTTSLEVARVASQIGHDPAARGGAVSIWWAIVASGMIAAGFARRVPLVRHGGLAFLFIVGAKIVAFDLHEVAAEWRIASFLSVGMLMLGVAVGYARLSSLIARKDVPAAR